MGMRVSILPNYYLSYDGYVSKYSIQLPPNYCPTTTQATNGYVSKYPSQLLANYHPSCDGYDPTELPPNHHLNYDAYASKSTTIQTVTDT